MATPLSHSFCKKVKKGGREEGINKCTGHSIDLARIRKGQNENKKDEDVLRALGEDDADLYILIGGVGHGRNGRDLEDILISSSNLAQVPIQRSVVSNVPGGVPATEERETRLEHQLNMVGLVGNGRSRNVSNLITVVDIACQLGDLCLEAQSAIALADSHRVTLVVDSAELSLQPDVINFVIKRGQ